ncbi:AMP-binding protein [Pseudonocardia sp. NPDC049154]|uniref:AMP-binding protein n=1 Tax=Pseudonocardia sp. NPDC049154 TaxID=3155501 RepID=UPI0033C23D58
MMIEVPALDDPRIPDRANCVLVDLLVERVREDPDRVLVRFADGSEWTRAQTLANARATAAALHAAGARSGDRILLWMPNGPEAVRSVVAASLLGATVVPVSTAYRGSLLAQTLHIAGVRTGVVHAELVDRLAELGPEGRADLASVLVARGAVPVAPTGLELVEWDTAHAQASDLLVAERPHEPWDTLAVLFTSGTTGPSKAVPTTYVQHHSFQTSVHEGRLGPEDRVLVQSPMSHMMGVNSLYGAVLFGSSIALTDGFDTARFWATIAETGATCCSLVGSQLNFMVKSGREAPAGHRLRRVTASPVDEAFAEFGRRYGVRMETGFAMTEVPSALRSDPATTPPGSCGRVRPGMQVRLVDEFDREVPDGTPGELIVRADRPWTIAAGYLGMPEATARAWRNGWFHTGDALRRDAEGNYYFVDRLKDAIRRRGENISSAEVEAEVLRHPAVRMAAVVGVASEFGEQEVLAAVVPADGTALDPVDLLELLRGRLPYFMVPRYVRVLADLPLTATGRVQKSELRSAGVTEDTWDRDAAGIGVHRERLT